MTCALKLGLVISGRSSLMQCAVSFLGAGIIPPVSLYSAQRLTWRDASPGVWREEERNEPLAGWGRRSIYPLNEPALSPVAGLGPRRRGEEARVGPVLFQEKESQSLSGRVEVRWGLLESDTGRQPKQFVHRYLLVLDFQIILIFRTCGLFWVQMSIFWDKG